MFHRYRGSLVTDDRIMVEYKIKCNCILVNYVQYCENTLRQDLAEQETKKSL